MSVAAKNTPVPRGMEAMTVAGIPVRLPTTSTGASRPWPLWACAGSSVVGARFPVIAESLSAALGLERGHRVLDLGAGSGHVALSAGRRRCQVVSVIAPEVSEYMQALLERDRDSVATEGLAVDFWRWDVASLPFADADFDVVSSSFAAMFELDQEEMAREMLRLCRPGGKVGIVSWTPKSFLCQLFRMMGAHVPQPRSIRSPFAWGIAERLAELFGHEAKTIDVTPCTFIFRYSSPRQCLDIWRSTYEPLRQALEAADAAQRDELTRDLQILIDRCNVATDGSVSLRGDYLEAVVHKRARPYLRYSH